MHESFFTQTDLIFNSLKNAITNKINNLHKFILQTNIQSGAKNLIVYYPIFEIVLIIKIKKH